MKRVTANAPAMPSTTPGKGDQNPLPHNQRHQMALLRAEGHAIGFRPCPKIYEDFR